MADVIPVITMDGPGGSGKTTIAKVLAKHLGWHFLDSGALYRCVAFLAMGEGMALEEPTDTEKLVALATNLDIHFIVNPDNTEEIHLNGKIIADEIRSQSCGAAASKIAANPAVRQALLQKQHDFRQAPGLVADGRDMGTIVFPDAPLKFFIDASPEKRAERRQAQLAKIGIAVELDQLTQIIAERDHRDRNRKIAPLKTAGDAIIIDTTELTIEQTLEKVLLKINSGSCGQAAG